MNKVRAIITKIFNKQEKIKFTSIHKLNHLIYLFIKEYNFPEDEKSYGSIKKTHRNISLLLKFISFYEIKSAPQTAGFSKLKKKKLKAASRKNERL